MGNKMGKWIGFAVAAFFALVPASADSDCRLKLAASLELQAGATDRVLIPSQLDGNPLVFAIDTGSPISAISQAAVDRLGMKMQMIRSSSAPYLPYAGGRATRFVRAKTLQLGTMTAPNVALFVMPADMHGADGLMGADFLAQFDVDFDFANGKVNLFWPHSCDDKVVYWAKETAVAVLPFHFESNDAHIHFDGKLDGHTIPFILDTGAPTTSIGIDMAKSWFNIDENSPGVEDRGHGYYSKRFSALTLEGISVANPLVTIRRQSHSNTSNYEAFLGLNTLKHLHLFVAYKARKLYITEATAK